LNPRHAVYKTAALPLSYTGLSRVTLPIEAISHYQPLKKSIATKTRILATWTNFCKRLTYILILPYDIRLVSAYLRNLISPLSSSMNSDTS
jgi:hypothetical protein